MKIYYYSESGFYLGENTAMPNPLEIGEYLIPSNATAIAPPTMGVDETAIFDTLSESWSVVESHIGKEGYLSDEPYTVDELGALPVGFSLDKPLSVLKQEKTLELNLFVSDTIQQGITELGIKVTLDQTTLGYLASIAYLNNVDNVIHDSEDIYHTGLSNADVSQVLEVALQAYHDLIAYKKSKEIEIESALDKTELDLIVIGTDFSL
jgi:hypothetical protein